MKKYILGLLFVLVFMFGAIKVYADDFNQQQVNAIVSVLQAFNLGGDKISRITAILLEDNILPVSMPTGQLPCVNGVDLFSIVDGSPCPVINTAPVIMPTPIKPVPTPTVKQTPEPCNSKGGACA